MTVYADVLVIVNLYIDFFLLWCVKKALGFAAKTRRLALGALIGAVFSLSALAPLGKGCVLLLGIAAAPAIVAAAFAPVGLKAILRAAVCFWGASMLLAGFFLFLLRFTAPGHIAVAGSIVYLDLSLPMLFFFTCGAYLVLVITAKLLPKSSFGLGLVTLRVCLGGRCAEIRAKADTGNLLREPFSGLPVIVCERRALKALLPAQSHSAGVQGLRMIPFNSIGGSGLLPGLRPESVTNVKAGKPLNCWLAVSERPLSAGTYDAIFNPDQFN